MRKQPTRKANAKEAKHLLDFVVYLPQALDRRKVQGRKRHEEDGNPRHLARTHPDEQQHHDAGNGNALEREHHGCQELAHHRMARGDKTQDDTKGKRGKKAAGHMREGIPDDWEEPLARDHRHEGAKCVERARKQDLAPNEKACGLPRHNPERTGRKPC